VRWPHCGFNNDTPDILPSSLQKRDEVVDLKHQILHQVFSGHLNVPNSYGQAQDLLELEFDGRLNLSDLVGQVGHRDWVFANYVHA
jgi:hypothetical protein